MPVSTLTVGEWPEGHPEAPGWDVASGISDANTVTVQGSLQWSLVCGGRCVSCAMQRPGMVGQCARGRPDAFPPDAGAWLGSGSAHRPILSLPIV